MNVKEDLWDWNVFSRKIPAQIGGYKANQTSVQRPALPLLWIMYTLTKRSSLLGIIFLHITLNWKPSGAVSSNLYSVSVSVLPIYQSWISRRGLFPCIARRSRCNVDYCFSLDSTSITLVTPSFWVATNQVWLNILQILSQFQPAASLWVHHLLLRIRVKHSIILDPLVPLCTTYPGSSSWSVPSW